MARRVRQIMRFKWAARMGTPVCPVSAELHSFGKLSSAVHLIFGASANGGIAFRVFLFHFLFHLVDQGWYHLHGCVPMSFTEVH